MAALLGAADPWQRRVYSNSRRTVVLRLPVPSFSWEVGRLWAAVTATGGPVGGTLMTRVLRADGKHFSVNAVSLKEGCLTAELIVTGKPLPGFSRTDCVPIRGDHRSTVIRWKRGFKCSVENVQARFYLRRTRLYGFDF